MPWWIYGEELSQPVSPSAPSVQGTGGGGRLSKSGQVFSDPKTPLKSVQRRNSQSENNDGTADVKITLSAHQQPCPHHTQPLATLSLHPLHTHTRSFREHKESPAPISSLLKAFALYRHQMPLPTQPLHPSSPFFPFRGLAHSKENLRSPHTKMWPTLEQIGDDHVGELLGA